MDRIIKIFIATGFLDGKKKKELDNNCIGRGEYSIYQDEK